jgi:hypothetical protein
MNGRKKIAMPKTKQVIDVAGAGQTAPPASSRPIIVTRGKPVEDPMMTKLAAKGSAGASGQNSDDEPPAGTAASNSTLSSASRVTLTPLSEKAAPDAEEPKSAPPEPKAEQPPVADAAVINAVADGANASKNDQKKEEADSSRNDAIEQAIADKKYFINIRESKAVRKFENRLIIMLALLLLTLIAFNFALDAELINTNIRPITDLIK